MSADKPKRYSLPVSASSRILVVLLYVLFVGIVVGRSFQGPEMVQAGDNSDWWSSFSKPDVDDGIPTQEREIRRTNFQILGIGLGERMFKIAAAKLGEATTIERGDASTGRSQVCYASSVGRQKVYLIFEQGEVDFNFYLFVSDRAWNGRDSCRPSQRVSRSLSTQSGLRLGLSPAQVIAILGKPSVRRPNELIYSLHVRKKTSARELQSARKQNPGLSEQELIEDYGYYDLGVEVDVQFENSKLRYLTISKSETT